LFTAWLTKLPRFGAQLSFTIFYICLAGRAGWECCTAAIPIKWPQYGFLYRWYCPRCWAKYKNEWGLLIEVKIQGHVSYCRSGILKNDVKDTMAQIETYFQHIRGVEDLRACWPELVPTGEPSMLTPVGPVGDEVYTCRKTTFDALPEFEIVEV
jgi:hypothetical protein